MGDNIIYEGFKLILPIAIIIGGFALSVLIVTKYKVPKLESDMKKLTDIVDGIEREQNKMATKDDLLKSYLDPSGNPRYQPIGRCQEVREFCGRQNNILIEHLGNKIDEVGDRMVDVLNEIDKKRSEQQAENHKKFDDLADAIKETHESLNKTNEKLSTVAQKVEVITVHNNNKLDEIEKVAISVAKEIAKELKLNNALI
jgi:uncharacterized protein YoxC